MHRITYIACLKLIQKKMELRLTHGVAVSNVLEYLGLLNERLEILLGVSSSSDFLILTSLLVTNVK